MDLISQLSSQFQNALAPMNGRGDVGAGVGGFASNMPSSFSTQAYHGSGQLFDKFEYSKAGMGMYGHGLYFTQNPKVASMYAGNYGNVYSVDLPYSKEQFADFHKPISEQSKQVQDSLLKIIKDKGLNKFDEEKSFNKYSPSDVYDKLHKGDPKDASNVFREYGIKGHNFGGESSVVYSDKGINISNIKNKSDKTIKNLGNVSDGIGNKIKDIPSAVSKVGRYYAANPEEIAKGIGKGGVLAAVGAGVEYGLQKAIPKTQGANYFQEVYNNLRDFGIAGASGGVAGPLGASIGIGSELLKKTYDVGKDATGLIKYKIKSDQSIKDIEERKKKRASGY